MVEHAIVRAMTTIDDDGDAAWRVLAVSDTVHTLRHLIDTWPELTHTPLSLGEGIGVASPLLFVARGPQDWVQRQSQQLQREADRLLARLRAGESDPADELVWLQRPLRRRSGRFNAETWRLLALLQILQGDELATPNHLTGQVDTEHLSAFYVVPPMAESDELEALAARAIEAWLTLQES